MNDERPEPGPSEHERGDLEAHVDACAKRYWHLARQHQTIKRNLRIAIGLLLLNTGVSTQSLGFKSLVKWFLGS
ncbi:MAG: hypothetical protein QNK44_07885 [Hyphomicrobiaceae bacterium]|nr:hypothetical protein [Hyphomicrobiaceae bacterium]